MIKLPHLTVPDTSQTVLNPRTSDGVVAVAGNTTTTTTTMMTPPPPPPPLLSVISLTDLLGVTPGSVSLGDALCSTPQSLADAHY